MARSHARVQVGDRFSRQWGDTWPDISEIPAFTYMLMWKGEVVYVGMSTKIKDRLSSHNCRGGKLFDSAEVIACASQPSAWDLEGELIREHRPRYNVQLTHHGKGSLD